MGKRDEEGRKGRRGEGRGGEGRGGEGRGGEGRGGEGRGGEDCSFEFHTCSISLGSQVIDDEGGDTEGYSVGTQRPHDQHPLQLVARVLPFTCSEARQ